MKKIKIIIDPELCIGAASCVTIKPEYYQLNDINKAIVMDPSNLQAEPSYTRELEVSDTDFEGILLGAESCPTRAISIFDEDGNQLYPKSPSLNSHE